MSRGERYIVIARLVAFFEVFLLLDCLGILICVVSGKLKSDVSTYVTNVVILDSALLQVRSEH